MIAREKPLDVIVVGAGFGGLAAAIECSQRGLNVTVLEKYTDSNSQGGSSSLKHGHSKTRLTLLGGRYPGLLPQWRAGHQTMG